MRGVLKLIEKQRAMWDIRGRLDESDGQPGRYVENGVSYGPCLLISRECGSGGGEAARLASERLGWPCYDREIVDQIAELSHARQHLVESVDEVVRSRWESAWRPMIDSEDLGCEAYLCYLRQVVMTLGHHGNAILLGRGAQYFLPVKSSLRVRLVAPLEMRVKRMAGIKNMTLQEADAWVREYDKERTLFIRKNFNTDPNSAITHDLMINTGEIPPREATDIILAALKQKLGVSCNNSQKIPDGAQTPSGNSF